MSILSFCRTAAITAALLASASLMSTATAGDAVLGDINITQAWARASAGPVKAGGSFMTITNKGASDRLLKASADVSEVVELHTHIMDGNVMRMRQVEAIDVAGGGTTMLQPGGLHIMLIGLKKPLAEGSSFPLTLTFEKAGVVEVTVDVMAPGAMGGNMGKGMKHGQHGKHMKMEGMDSGN